MKSKVFLFLFITSIVFSQECYWHTYGGIGHGDDNNVGFTVGQTVASHFSHLGDSISYGFWLVPWDAILCVSVADSVWEIPDTVSMGETVSMTLADAIDVYNCSNCWIDYGIYWHTSSGELELGYLPANDRAVVRAQFRDDLIVPTLYSVSDDYIKPSMTWSTYDVFGPDGVEVGPDRYRKLWFQFVAPMNLERISSGFHSITFILQAKISLP